MARVRGVAMGTGLVVGLVAGLAVGLAVAVRTVEKMARGAGAVKEMVAV